MAEFTNLGKDESVVRQATVHWKKLIVPGIFALLFIIAGLSSEDSSAAAMGVILGVIILLIAMIPIWTTKLIITNKRIMGKTGLIKTKTLDAPLNKVNTVSVSSGLGGKIFGYGKIHITTSSGDFLFSGIQAPSQFRQVLMEQIDRFDDDRIKKQASEMARAMRGIGE